MSKGKYIRKEKRKIGLYPVILVVLIAVFLISAWQIGTYFLESQKQESRYEELASMVEQVREELPKSAAPTEAQTPGDAAVGENTEAAPTEPEILHNEAGILLEYAPLYDMNPDMAGWISIPGTEVNYPVMHTPGRTDYYLYRNFDKEDSSRGCIYIREECDPVMPSDNITIYGHHMRDGSMFAALDDYSEQSFWQEHRYIYFDTITEHHTYEIFAVFITTASVGEGFAYHEFVNAANKAEFDTFVARCKALDLYDTGITPEYGDKLICLSTCDYSLVNGRLVVAARRID